MKPDIIDKVQSSYQEKMDTAEKTKEKSSIDKKDDQLARLILEGNKAQIKHRDIHEPKVEVKNFPDLASPEDMDKLVSAIEGLTVSNYSQAEDNAEMISEALGELSDQIGALPRELTVEPVVEALKTLVEATSKVPAEIKDTSPAIVKAISDLENSVKKLEMAPNITVSPAEVTIPAVDLSGVAQAIDGLKPVDKFDFSRYMAQDLDDQIDGIQYVLLVNPEGAWCILENNSEYNTLRYKFGTDDYTQAWANVDTLNYQRMDKAVDEVTA